VNVSAAAAVSTTGRTFMLPDLGEGLTEAEVIEWHVGPGDQVRVDQVVVTVETAKATVDLPCPYAGSVITLHGAPGAVLQVGRPLLTIGEQREELPTEKSGSGNVLVGYGTSEARRTARRRTGSGGQPPAAARPVTTPATPAAPATPATPATPAVPVASVAPATPVAPDQPIASGILASAAHRRTRAAFSAGSASGLTSICATSRPCSAPGSPSTWSP